MVTEEALKGASPVCAALFVYVEARARYERKRAERPLSESEEG